MNEALFLRPEHFDGIDEEDIENQLYSAKMVDNLGFMDLNHFEEFKHHAALGSLKFGGKFMKCLGEALSHADHNNAIKLIYCFKETFSKHAMLFRMEEAKLKAEKS